MAAQGQEIKAKCVKQYENKNEKMAEARQILSMRRIEK